RTRAPGPSPPRPAARAGWRRGGSTWRSGCTGCSSPRSTWAPWLPRPAWRKRRSRFPRYRPARRASGTQTQAACRPAA
ncbi:RNA-binding protein KhpA, partial [Dysosmobacter welbionis]